MKRRLIGLLVGVMCLTSLVGCGDKSENSEKDVAKTIENAVNDTVGEPNSNSNSGANSGKETGEEKYVALDEIVNAKFEDHVIQIGDEIFQEGGYITFGELVEQLGDKYTCTDMTADGLIAKGKGESVHIKKNDSSISIKAYIENNTDEQISAADAIVVSVLPDGDFAEANTFITGGLSLDANDMSYQDVVEYFKSFGYISSATSKSSKIFDYHAGSILEADDKVAARTVGKDKNLYGVNPTLGYCFMIDTSVNKVSEIWLSDGTTDGFIDAKREKGSWIGIPVTSFDEISDTELNDLYDIVKNYLVEESKGYSNPYVMENLRICESYILNMKKESITIDGTEYGMTELYVIVEINDVYDKTNYLAVNLTNLVTSVLGTTEYGQIKKEFNQESLERVYKGTGADYDEDLILDSRKY